MRTPPRSGDGFQEALARQQEMRFQTLVLALAQGWLPQESPQFNRAAAKVERPDL
jgi:hypothetical protein